MSFADLGLSSSILKAVSDMGYETPTPIQLQAIPAVLAQRDLLAAAQTGTGKTAGFTLPILHRLSESGNQARGNQVRALVLTPTRELAAQVEESVVNYGKYLPLRSAVVFGGVKINPQMIKLKRGVDILVATPGRLLDLHNQNAVRFDQLEILVLDEADRMLDMGFINDIKKILRVLPKERQNLMFSATFAGDVRTLAKTIVNNPVEIAVAPTVTTAKSVTQWIIPVDKGSKPSLLTQVIGDNNWQQVLVFSKTKHGANRLAAKLESSKITAAAIHGNKSQGARTRALADFKSGAVRVLVATDIAARGLDIDELPHVINFDLPNVPADYVHRIGRTGRAGASGEALSFVCHEDLDLLADIQNLTGELLERREYPGFKPERALPDLVLNVKIPRIKKPKPARSEHRDGQRAPARPSSGRTPRPQGDGNKTRQPRRSPNGNS
ncbi:MAG: ATP-dependent RNA helicase RhlE [Reinekea sp.]|jgi:ATP-dependent RNA helicase RhlE